MDSELRNALRHYFQSGDITLFPSIVAYTNRGGPATIVETIAQLCTADLNGLELALVRRFGGIAGQRILVDRSGVSRLWDFPRCSLRFQKLGIVALGSLQAEHSIWDITVGITYITPRGTEVLPPQDLIGLPQDYIMRGTPLLMIYPKGILGPEIVGPIFRTINNLFPHYAVEITSTYPARHEVIYGCHICGVFPKAMGSDYCKRHTKTI